MSASIIPSTTRIEWTPDFVQNAIQSAMSSGDMTKIDALASRVIPESFVAQNPLLTYEFLSNVVTSTPLLPRVKDIYVQMLRQMEIPESLDSICLANSKEKQVSVNIPLARLVIPDFMDGVLATHRFPLSVEAALEIKKYIETGAISSPLSVKVGLSLMAFARNAKDDYLREAAFKSLFEIFAHQKDTLEERCFMLGLGFLNGIDVGYVSQLEDYKASFCLEFMTLIKENPDTYKDMVNYNGIITVGEWEQLLMAMGVVEGSRPQFSCLGPIRPSAFQTFAHEQHIAGAAFRTLLALDKEGVELRLRTQEDLTMWKQISVSMGLDSYVKLRANCPEKRIKVRLIKVRLIEVDSSIAQSLFPHKPITECKLVQTQAVHDAGGLERLADLIGCRGAHVLVGFCMYPGLESYPNR